MDDPEVPEWVSDASEEEREAASNWASLDDDA